MAARSIRSAGVRRLLQEHAELQQDSCADYNAAPLEDDLFSWHFTLRVSSSDYHGGVYHGKLILPSDYPFKPPEVYMLTPSGRFEVNKKICLSISSFHPETWQPSWGIRTALLAIMAFFETDPKGAVGSLEYPSADRRRLALASRTFKCGTCGFDASEAKSCSGIPLPPLSGKEEKSNVEQPPSGESEKQGTEVEVETDAAGSEVSTPCPAPLLEVSSSPVLVTTPPAASVSPASIFPAAPPPTSGPSAHAPHAVTPPPYPTAPPHRPPHTPRHRAPQPHHHHHAAAAAGDPTGALVPPGAPRLSPAHLPARAPSYTGAAAARPPNPLAADDPAPAGPVPALPPGLGLARAPLGESAAAAAGMGVGAGAGGPPLWVDRAILACLLALLALVVRKVA
ncbi:uncharacterized protein JCM10292_006462 [Rhodotorula paludigena]|uniref:uncharacterized protein n=1 Tax=Rhodotorula paludigena TaxID=86838 RepID=UPI003174C329